MSISRLFFAWRERVPRFLWSAPGNKDVSPLPERPLLPGRPAGATLLERLRLRVPSAQEPQRGILLLLIVSVLGCVALGLTLVWLNTERTRLALRAHALQREMEERQELRAKLEVEHASLVSPAVLIKKAASLGLRPALPGEIRRMERESAPEPDAGEK